MAARRGLPGPPDAIGPPALLQAGVTRSTAAAVSLGDGHFPRGQAEEERGQPQHFSGGDFIPRSALFVLFPGGLVWDGQLVPGMSRLGWNFFPDISSKNVGFSV